MNLSPLAASLLALILTLNPGKSATAQTGAAPPRLPEQNFVKVTGFTYGAWRSGVIGGGGYAQNVVPCPSNAKRFYCYVDVGGLYRSDDGARTWKMLHGHLPYPGGNCSVRGVLVDPRDDRRIIVATGWEWAAKEGLYLSTDAGENFTKVLAARFDGNGGSRAAGFILTRDPNNPDILATAAINDGVFLSRDNGVTWTLSGATGLYACDLRFDRSNSRRLWLCANRGKLSGTTFTAGFYRSEDAGATWSQLEGEVPSELIQDPKDPSLLYGIFGNAVIRRSTDGGTSWTDWSQGLTQEPLVPGKGRESISKAGYGALAAGPDFVVTCNTRDSDFFKLTAGGDKWEKIARAAPEVGDWYHKNGWAFGAAAGSLTVDPHDANHWFMTDFFAVYQTWDGGNHWRLTVDGIETTVAHCLLQDPSDAGVLHIGLADVGNFNSTDGGNRFVQAKVPDDPTTKANPAGGGNMKCIDLCPKLPSRLYAVANNNYYVLWQANMVFISTDRGNTWTRSQMVGLPATNIAPCTTITADLGDPNTVYLTVAGQVKPGGGGVYKSTDGGTHWAWMSEGMPLNSWYFPFDIWAHGRQLAASADGSLIAISKGSGLVCRYVPASGKWEHVSWGHHGQLWCVVADRLKAGRYFVGVRDDGLYRTDDSGLSWRKVYDKSVSFVATDAAVAGRVAGGTMDGVILSTDGGDSFRVMDRELPNRTDAIPAFAGDRLFAATAGNGVFWMPLTPAAAKPVAAKIEVPQTASPKIASSNTASLTVGGVETPAPAAVWPASLTPAERVAPPLVRAGETRIAKWQGDKKAAFLLMFDDGWPSQWQVAIPELAQRKLTATFYIVPKKGEFSVYATRWKKLIEETGMAVGNHTMTHDGVTSPEDAEMEFTACTNYILDNFPGKRPRLISFAQPGGVTWNLSRENEKVLLAENHLVDRPPFQGHGAVYHWQKVEQMLALADKAIAAGGMEYLVIHGVERLVPDWHYQDFWALKQNIFFPLLDGLKDRSEKGDLWVTDHISQHQYATEFTTAKVLVLEASPKAIRLQLTCDADPQFYDLPLTLITQVPPTWKFCRVTQGATQVTVATNNGKAQFQAVPGKDPVVLLPTTTP